MKTIKFRAWDKKEKKMCIPHLSMFLEKNNNFSEDNNLVLMQFTGLLDKNGKEIFEGDIISFGQNSRRVNWVGAGFWLIDFCGNGIDIEPTFNEIKNWKIIGNIYENPELLTL